MKFLGGGGGGGGLKHENCYLVGVDDARLGMGDGGRENLPLVGEMMFKFLASE